MTETKKEIFNLEIDLETGKTTTTELTEEECESISNEYKNPSLASGVLVHHIEFKDGKRIGESLQSFDGRTNTSLPESEIFLCVLDLIHMLYESPTVSNRYKHYCEVMFEIIEDEMQKREKETNA